LAYLAWGMKTGKISDFDITKREQRYGILTATLISFLISLIITYYIGNEIVFQTLAIIITFLTIVYFITFYWKISLHMGVNVLSVILVNFFYGWKLPWLYLAIPLIFWSRYTLKKHTPLQLILGAIVSGTVALGGLKIFGYI
jgi:membrane-associated phospholipid phosphatase